VEKVDFGYIEELGVVLVPSFSCLGDWSLAIASS